MLLMLATGWTLLRRSRRPAAMNNLGPGLGSVANNYHQVSEIGKIILCFAMLLGRLEVFTLLVLFTPAFWRP